MVENIQNKINSLTIFKGILSDNVFSKFYDFIMDDSVDTNIKIKKYSSFVSELYKESDNFSKYLLELVLQNENVFLFKKISSEYISDNILSAVYNDLKILQEISKLESSKLKKLIDFDGFLPDYEIEKIDFAKCYFKRVENIKKFGYGIFSKHSAFSVDNEVLVPVKNLDSTRLEDLKGYEKEKNTIISNTVALLEGKPYSNVLLYGDSGTGKSSTIKGIINEFKDKGLRLIEVKKNQLHALPKILESLFENPLKFIIFIDDLSFSENDNDFAALKAILEGSVSSNNNTAVYVTSNRRHLIKESFSDRAGDDIHVSDSMEELTALSERFGIRITFSRPDKDTYIEILKYLAEKYSLKTDISEVISKGEIFAINRSGRTPRVAKQFIEILKSQEE